MSESSLTIPYPDDWHVHLRDGPLLDAVIADTARHFRRAIVMPNLTPPVTLAMDADAYRRRIEKSLPDGSQFEPLMTCYLTDTTQIDDLLAGARDGIFTAAKLYPAGATTHSEAGVTDIRRLDGVFEAMSGVGLPLLVHGEVVDADVDVFDREAVFIDRVLEPLRQRHPELKIVFEHVTTADAIDFVLAGDTRWLTATITPHHLMINRNAMFAGGLRPHMYCLPLAKRERHRRALRGAACSGDARFFLGTDSAPHPATTKESDCGCAGIYNAPVALAAYLRVFEEERALDRFEAFASLNGPAFYGLPVNDAEMRFERRTRDGKRHIRSSKAGAIVVFDPPGDLQWQAVIAP
ncbi:MAG: dihydroorotase [Gammaproteobacteria bacterium]|nr:dihydroorotase [Gammaproteobacteria bacterium]